MEFEQLAAGSYALGNYASARDFFCLAALFFGAGLGCVLNRFRRKATARFRNAALTAGICLFSGTLAALTPAIIYSNWAVFSESSLYLPAGILAFLLALALRFPRAAGFPIILVSGIFVVWTGYACLRFPVVDDSGSCILMRDGNGLVNVRLLSASKTEAEFSFQPAGQDSTLEFRTMVFSLPKTFPLAGGVKRGFITEIRENNETLYTDSRPGRFFFPGLYPWPGAGDRYSEAWVRFFSFGESSVKYATGDLLPGITVTVCIEN